MSTRPGGTVLRWLQGVCDIATDHRHGIMGGKPIERSKTTYKGPVRIVALRLPAGGSEGLIKRIIEIALASAARIAERIDVTLNATGDLSSDSRVMQVPKSDNPTTCLCRRLAWIVGLGRSDCNNHPPERVVLTGAVVLKAELADPAIASAPGRNNIRVPYRRLR